MQHRASWAQKERVNKAAVQRSAWAQRPAGLSAGDMMGGRATLQQNERRSSAELCGLASVCTANLPQPLGQQFGLFWTHRLTSYEQQVEGQSLSWSTAVPAYVRAKTAPGSDGPKMRLWVSRSCLKTPKKFRNIIRKCFLLLSHEEVLSRFNG